MVFALLLASSALRAQTIRETDVRFTNDKYINFFKGRTDGVKMDMKGEVLNEKFENIGAFSVISIEDYEGFGLLENISEDNIPRIAYVSIQALNLHHVRFELPDSRLFCILPGKGANCGIAPSMKGELLQNGQMAGNFRIIGVKDSVSYALVTSMAPESNFRNADRVIFQDYKAQILNSSGFANLTYKNLIMLLIGCLFIYLAISKDYEPLLLVPIGFGILVGNIPLPLQIFNSISVYMIDPISQQYVFNNTSNSVLGMIYFLVRTGVFPPLIFLGIGAMTDFTAMLSNPKSFLLGAAAQLGIFTTFIGALLLGFSPASAASIGIIGGADGPTAIFLASRLAPTLIGPIAIAAYSYMAMVPIIQPPIMKLLTTKKERLIRMKPGRKVSRLEKIMLPIVGMILTCLVAPGAIPLLGMLFFGNLLKESGVTARLAKTAANSLIDICTILLGLVVGASTSAQVFLNEKSVLIFALGCAAFAIATAAGVLFAKFLNLFSKNKINPLIGAAGVSAVPDSARVAHIVGQAEDPNNYLLMHAMGPNVAGVIGSAIAAGVFLGLF